jgi:putative membrane protein
MPTPARSRGHFWNEAFSLRGSATPRVLPNVLAVGLIATAVYFVYLSQPWIAIEVGPHEVGGALLGLLLVLRTNAGYDRWWEARKLWGGIVNQARNLAVCALAYGPDDLAWRDRFVRWVIAFAHVTRARLRGQARVPELGPLLGEAEAGRVLAAEHMPTFVALQLAEMLHDACARHGMDRHAFLQAERERALLVDHLGGCERILNTPLPRVYSITIRRFVLLYLGTVPFALLHKFQEDWMVPFVTMLVAYPVLGLDQIGVELQNPFSPRGMSHLPLDQITDTIEENLLALLRQAEVAPEARPRPPGLDGSRALGAPRPSD